MVVPQVDRGLFARLRRLVDDAGIGDRRAVRNRRLLMTSLSGGLSKVLAVLAGLVTIPLTVNYLGVEQFGMWMTMSSLIAFLSFADLGIGNGVLSAVATANGNDDREEMRRIISSGYAALGGVSLAMLILMALSYHFVDWNLLFNARTPEARAEAGPAVAVLVTCLALMIPLGLVQRVQSGLQCGFIANLWQCAASLLSMAGVTVVILLKGSLPWLVLAFVGATVVVQAVNTAIFFLMVEPSIAPIRSAVSTTQTKAILKIGALFLFLQVVATLTYMSDNIIIAQSLGAEAVPDYAIPEKLFAVVSAVLAMVLAPLWPAYGEAIARGDAEWMRRTLRRSMVMAGGLAACASGLLFLLAPSLIRLWVGNVVEPGLLLLTGFAIWKVIEAMGNALAMFLNGARVITFQVVCASLTAISSLGAKLFLVQTIGVAGVVWSTIACFSLFVFVPFLMVQRRILERHFRNLR